MSKPLTQNERVIKRLSEDAKEILRWCENRLVDQTHEYYSTALLQSHITNLTASLCEVARMEAER